MAQSRKTILIHAAAPAKPVFGTACNGCGVCCGLAPCPLGVILSARRHGSCVALYWHDETQRYWCGVLREPVRVLHRWLPSSLGWLGAALGPVLSWLAKRWIGVGQGCDASVEVV